jgi:hypothetical protein
MINNMKKIVSHIPLISITGLMIRSIYIVETGNIIFTYEHYIGIALIILSLLTLKYNIVISKLATCFVLLLGVFSQAAFTPVISRIRLGFTIGGIGLDLLIHPYCFFLIALFIILNWDFLRNAIGKNPIVHPF